MGVIDIVTATMMLLQMDQLARTLLKGTAPLKMLAGVGTMKSMIALLFLAVKAVPLATSQQWCGKVLHSWVASRVLTMSTTATSKVMIRLTAPHPIVQDVMKIMSQHR